MFVVTLDIDWAPDPVVDAIAKRLLDASMPATWFVTHTSPAVERLAAHPGLFELGVHPNFMLGTTHGETPEAVLDTVMAWVPDAVSVRTHGLVSYTNLLRLFLERTSLRIDCSLYLPTTVLRSPHRFAHQGRALQRLHHIWEDDLELESGEPVRVPAGLIDGEGVAIFDFHPIHVFLNSPSMGPYDRYKASQGAALESFVHTGEGVGTWFDGLLSHHDRATTLARAFPT